jgi:hypothetical protein
VKITKSTQEKMELAFKAIDYKIRYEKGNFQSGYCVLSEQKVVVINKFFPLESKVSALAEILIQVNPELTGLDAAQIKLLRSILPQEESRKA